MKRLLLPILFVLNFLCLNAQEVRFISVNSADSTLENITFKRLPKLLDKDTLRPDTLTTPAKWMLKLSKKLSKKQCQDSNIYIFFCHNLQDSVTAFLPLSGKCGYVLFDTTITNVVELEKVQKRLSTHKYQWDLIHDPQAMIALFQDEEEGAMMDRVATIIAAMQEANGNSPGTVIDLPWYGGTSSMEGTVKIGNDEIDCEIIPKSKDYIGDNKIKYTVPDFTEYFTRPGGTTERYYTCDGYRISFRQFTIKVKPPAIRTYDYDWLKEQTYRIRNYINNNASALTIDYAARIQDYNNRYSAAGSEEAKKDVVKEFLEEDIYSKYYTGLSVDLRVAAIKGVMDIKHLYIEINDQEEQEILFLLDNINDRDISSFLKKLETEKYKGKSLAIKMLEDFQDAVTVAEVFGTQRDYYTSLLQIFIKHSVKDRARLAKLENYSPNNTVKLSIVPWWQGASHKDFNYKLELKESKVLVQEECYLPTGEKVQRYNSQGLPLVGVYDYSYKWYQSNIQQEYSPFDLIVLDDRSNLSSDILKRIYSGETVLDGLKVMPAAAMHYIKQKRRNQTIEELSYITVDVLAMAVGVGELALAAKAISNSRKVVVVIDIMNSAANIAVNTTELQKDKNVQKWLQIYNAATVFNNLAAGYKGGKNLAKIGTKAFGQIELSDLVKYPPFNNGANAGFAEDALKLYNKAIETGELSDWKRLEEFFKNNKLNGIEPGPFWPPMDGGFNIRKSQNIKVNSVYDRFQQKVYWPDGYTPKVGNIIDPKDIINGNYLSPITARTYSFAERALAGKIEDYCLEYEIIVKQSPDFTQDLADVIPWHTYKGMGKQSKFNFDGRPLSWNRLFEMGVFELRVKSSPSGMFELLPDGKLKILKL